MIQRPKAFAPPAGITPPPASEKPPIKRAPAAIYRRPPPTGPGADNIRSVKARLREQPPIIATYRGALQAVATAQGVCIPLIDRMGSFQLNLAATVQERDAQSQQQAFAAAMIGARRELQDALFTTVAERRHAEEARAKAVTAQVSDALADSIAEERKDEATALVNRARDAILAARQAIIRSEFERDVDVASESDAEFLRKVEALRTKVASMLVFQRAAFALELYRRALALGDEPRQRLIEAALLPVMTEMVLDGAAKIRAVDSRAGRAGDATKTLNAANLFVNKATEQQKARDGSDELATARIVQGQLELCFLKTGGIDVSDSSSVSGAQFTSWMNGGRAPASLTEDLPIDPKWLTRPLRAKTLTRMPPYQGPSAEIAVRAGKAVSR